MSLPPPPVFLEGIGYVPPDEAEVIVANLERQNSLNLGQKNIIDENNVSDITIDSNVSIDVSCIIDINDQSAVIPENSAEELEQDEEEKIEIEEIEIEEIKMEEIKIEKTQKSRLKEEKLITPDHELYNLLYSLKLGMRTRIVTCEKEQSDACKDSNVVVYNLGNDFLPLKVDEKDDKSNNNNNNNNDEKVLRVCPPTKSNHTKDFKSSDFKAEIKLKFPVEGSKHTPPLVKIEQTENSENNDHKNNNNDNNNNQQSLPEFLLKDYAPKVFQSIRELYSIDVYDYIHSIAGNDGYYSDTSHNETQNGNNNNQTEKLLLETRNKKYIIKTITQDESLLLRKSLPDYYEYVKNSHNNTSNNANSTLTLINPYYGLYRIETKNWGKRYFVILGNNNNNNNNVVQSDENSQTSKTNKTNGISSPAEMIDNVLTPVRIYNIKGLNTNLTVNDNDKHYSNAIYKENDIINEQNIKIIIQSEKIKLALKKQFQTDLNFCKRLKLINYTFVIGIYRINDVNNQCGNGDNNNNNGKNNNNNNVIQFNIFDIFSIPDKNHIETDIVQYMTNSDKYADKFGHFVDKYCFGDNNIQ
jgi:hypothetical protein